MCLTAIALLMCSGLAVAGPTVVIIPPRPPVIVRVPPPAPVRVAPKSTPTPAQRHTEQAKVTPLPMNPALVPLIVAPHAAKAASEPASAPNKEKAKK